MASKLNPIRHCRNEKGAGAEMRPAIVSGIVTRARQSTIGQFFHSPGNSPRCLCESKLDPVSPRFLNSWRMRISFGCSDSGIVRVDKRYDWSMVFKATMNQSYKVTLVHPNDPKIVAPKKTWARHSPNSFGSGELQLPLNSSKWTEPQFTANNVRKGTWNRIASNFSKIQLVVYYQCCVVIGWATTRLYVIAH